MQRKGRGLEVAPTPRHLSAGRVELVDFMGGDLAVVNSARISFAKVSKSMSPGDEKLIDFLMRNRHGTPFESSVFTFQVQAPITVAREWVRHRISCLAPDAEVVCVQPNGSSYNRTIEHIYRTHHGVPLPERWIRNGRGRHRRGARTKVPATRGRTWRGQRALRVLGSDGLSVGVMKDVWEAGVKPLFLLKTRDGRELRASSDHRIKTPDGWAKVSELSATDAVVRLGKVAVQEPPIPRTLRVAIQHWTALQRRKVIGQGADCHLCGDFFWEENLHLDHVVPITECLEWALDVSNLAPACRPCHREKTAREQPRGRRSEAGVRPDRLVCKPVLVGESMTYDLEMEGPNHNYVANHIVVHNSWNEVSGRYTELEPRFFLPDPERVRTQVGKPGDYSFEPVEPEDAESARLIMMDVYETCWHAYQALLNRGVAKELARSVLPVALFTEWRWTVNARSLMNFLELRTSKHAMREIRDLANQVGSIFLDKMPVTHAAFFRNNMKAP